MNNFIVIQDWMLDFDLSHRETMLYAIIYGFTQDGETWCYATQEYLARWLKCTTPTLLKSIQALLDAGLIEKRKTNARGDCAYRAIVKGKETLPLSENKGKETLPYNINNNDNIDSYNNMAIPSPSASTTAEYEREFADLWSIYPRKEGKARARRAYIAARRAGIRYEAIAEGVRHYTEKVNSERTPARYIKNGGNWFAGHRWDDDPAFDTTANAEAGQPQKKQLRSLNYRQRVYTKDQLIAAGIDFGDDVFK